MAPARAAAWAACSAACCRWSARCSRTAACRRCSRASRQNGLAEQASSWLGTGANEPISADDVRKVVGSDELAKIAGQLGISEDDAASALAQVLPAVVDKVSPDGQLPPAGELDAALGHLGDAASSRRLEWAGSPRV